MPARVREWHVEVLFQSLGYGEVGDIVSVEATSKRAALDKALDVHREMRADVYAVRDPEPRLSGWAELAANRVADIDNTLPQ